MRNKNKTIHVAGLTITTYSDGTGTIDGTLKEKCPHCGQPDCYCQCEFFKDRNSDWEDLDTTVRREYNNAMNGIESLLLALALEGIDVSSLAFVDALEVAQESVANNL